MNNAITFFATSLSWINFEVEQFFTFMVAPALSVFIILKIYQRFTKKL